VGVSPSREDNYIVRPIGHVESSLVDLATAPKQGYEGAPGAWLVFEDWVREGLRDLRVGDEVIALTWLNQAGRDVLRVHPRGDSRQPERGVFSTRSPGRPNPIGLHRVRITAIVDIVRIEVQPLEAVDQTPIIDLKPVLTALSDA
jgi:tRNA-Thr(GGU) m(6)t(6)A37 methyltransferase TsaA